MRLFGWVTVGSAFAVLAAGLVLLYRQAIGHVEATLLTLLMGWLAMAGLLIVTLQDRIDRLERLNGPVDGDE